MNNHILKLENVSRLFPKDVSETGASLYREMMFPKTMFKSNHIDYFYAVERINMSVKKGEKICILGTHLSGKSTLAGIISGMIEPTEGLVTSYGSRHLINGKSSAGYKPMLKVIENLRLQAMFLGLHGDELELAIESTLKMTNLEYSDILKTTGNISQYLIRQLALIMSLQINSDILIFDNIKTTGTGSVREDIAEYIDMKINSSTSLIFESNPKLIEQVSNKIFLLHRGRLYGPFSSEEAVSQYYKLPEDNDAEKHYIKTVKGNKGSSSALLNIKRTFLNGEEYNYKNTSLIRKRGDILSLELNFITNLDFNLTSFVITLHPESEDEIMRFDIPFDNRSLRVNSIHKLKIDIEIPDLKPYRYGLAITPIQKNKTFSVKNRIKIVKFAILGHGIIKEYGKMNLKFSSFE